MVAALLLLGQLAAPGTPLPAATPHAAGANCRSMRLHDQTAAAQSCFQQLASSPDPYLQAEGDWGLGDYADANNAFREALAHNPDSVLIRVRWGRLLQARFNDSDAEDLFKEALQRDPKNAAACYGLALVSADGFDGQALDYARRAVALDPSLADAHVLLAEMALEDSDPGNATHEADLALAAKPDDLDAMAVHAAINVLALQPPDSWMAKIRAINPHYGEAESIIADQLILNRRYDEGVAYYRQAIAADPELWSAHSALGVTLMRLGQTSESASELELAYNHDYRDVATVNSLRLLDTAKNYVTIPGREGGQSFELMLDKKEAPLLGPYLSDLIRRAMTAYSAKYDMQLTQPVQVEAYPNHADFAVRSVALPGLGALGVTFGTVVAMDSPSGRPPGEFNWGATLWHEMDHVYILTMTHHLVPRWFAEGLAVHEEGQGNPEWADRPTPDDLVAIHAGRLLPVAQLDSGFMHPTYPGEVNVSYYQAGQICDFIQDHWDAAKLVEMAHDFSQPTTTAAVIQQALGLTSAAFDTAFQAWLKQRIGPEVNNFDAWRQALKDLVAHAMATPPDDAAVIQAGEHVISLYPDYVFDANAYGFVAAAYSRQGSPAKAEAALTEYDHRGGMDPKLLEQLADLEAQQKQPQLAAATLDRINYIYPMEAAPHRQLGNIWLGLHNYDGAIREFTAVVATHPLDVAGAEYDLARADFAAGKLDDAQDAVIQSLVAAHDYRPAQDLLVKIMDAKQQHSNSHTREH